MQEESQSLRLESCVMTVDPRDALAAVFITEFQLLSVVLQRNLWIFDQKHKDDAFKDMILNYCHLDRDQIFVIFPKEWNGSAETRRNIYERLANALSVNDVDNLQHYLKMNKSPQYLKIKNKFDDWSCIMKATEFLKIFRDICEEGIPMIQTRSLHVYQEEINSLDIVRQGAIDPLMLEIDEVPENDANKIGNVVMIGECYYYSFYDVINISYIRLEVPFFIAIMDVEEEIEKWRQDYYIGWKSGRQEGYQWEKRLRIVEIHSGNMDTEAFEMTMVYDHHCFDRVKEHLLTILRGNHYGDWIKKNRLQLFYGVKDREKLRDIRLLKTANVQYIGRITKLEAEVDKLKQQLQQMQPQVF